MAERFRLEKLEDKKQGVDGELQRPAKRSRRTSRGFKLWPHQVECVEAVLQALRDASSGIGVDFLVGE